MRAKPYESLSRDNGSTPDKGPLLSTNVLVVPVRREITAQEDRPDDHEGPYVSMQPQWHYGRFKLVFEDRYGALDKHTWVMQGGRRDHRVVHKGRHVGRLDGRVTKAQSQEPERRGLNFHTRRGVLHRVCGGEADVG